MLGFFLFSVKKGTPEDEDLEGWAKEIPLHWRKLGRRLKMKEADLNAIHKEKEEYCAAC